MSGSYDHYTERNALQEESAKLEAFVEDWEDEDYSDEGEEQLMIDLEKASASEPTGTGDRASTYSSFAETGSLKSTKASIEGEDEGGDARPQPDIGVGKVASQAAGGPEKALAINRALQGLMETHIEALTNALRENREAQAELAEELKDEQSNTSNKSIRVAPFRAPYFKNGTSWPPPNEDQKKKKEANEIQCAVIKDAVIFKKSSRENLRKAVLAQLRENRTTPLYAKWNHEDDKKKDESDALEALEQKLIKENERLNKLQKALSGSNKDRRDIAEKKELLETIKNINNEIQAKKDMLEAITKKQDDIVDELKLQGNISGEELLSNVDPEKVDWMKIARSSFRQHVSWLDCKKAWQHHVSLNLHSSVWRDQEVDRLRQLVEEHGMHQWEKVAGLLGTKRTAFQVFSYYQRNLNPSFKIRTWTEEEDEKLKEMASKIMTCYGFISWKKVAAMVDARSPAECMIRFSRIDKGQNIGKWTDKEDTRLLAAVEMFGKSWSKIAKFIGTRNMFQVRDRYLNNLDENLNYSHWTYEEDQKLLKVHKELKQQNMSTAWSKMVPHFDGRTDSMLLARIRTLNRWRDAQEWFDGQSKQVQNLLRGMLLPVKERKMREEKVRAILAKDMGIWPYDYKRIEKDKESGMDPDLIVPRPPFHLKLNRMFQGPGLSSQDTKQDRRWEARLKMVQQLLNNLRSRMKKLEDEMPEHKRGPRFKKTEDYLQGILDNPVSQDTDSQQTSFSMDLKVDDLPKNNLQQIQFSLNRLFLGDSNISVQDLLDQTSKKLKSKATWRETNNSRLMQQLRLVCRKRDSTITPRSLIGARKVRTFVAKDTRPPEVIEREMSKLRHTVPMLLAKSMGSDLPTLQQMAKKRRLDAEDQYHRHTDHSGDPEYSRQMAALEGMERELTHPPEDRPDLLYMEPGTKRRKLNGVLRKKNRMERAFKKNYSIKRQESEGEIQIHKMDQDYIEDLLGKKRAAPPTPPPSQEDNKDDVFKKPTGVAPWSTGRTKRRASEKARAMIQKSRMSPLRQKREPVVSPCRSKEEVEEERERLGEVGEKTYEVKLPSFPPCVSTMTALRTLLMVKTSLQAKAADLLHAVSNKEKSDDRTIHLAVESAAQSMKQEGGQQIMIPSDRTDVSQQAKQYSGFRMRSGPPDSSGGSNVEFKTPQHIIKKNESRNRAAVLMEGEEEDSTLSMDVSTNKQSIEAMLKKKPVDLTTEPIPEANVQVLRKGLTSEYEIVLAPSTKKQPSYAATPIRPRNEVRKTYSKLDRKIKAEAEAASSDSVTSAMSEASSQESATFTPSEDPSSDAESDVVVDERRSNKSRSIIMSSPSPGSFSSSSSIVKQEVMEREVDESPIPKHQHHHHHGTSSDTKPVITVSRNVDASTSSDEERAKEDTSSLKIAEQRLEVMAMSRKLARRPGLEGLGAPVKGVPMGTQSVPAQKLVSTRYMKPETLQRVELVGLDPSHKSIMHYKADTDTTEDGYTQFRVSETIPVYQVEESPVENNNFRPVRLPSKETLFEQKMKTGEYMQEVRQMNEYKLLFERFKALFLWPGVMSTIVPPEIKPISEPPGDAENRIPRYRSGYSKCHRRTIKEIRDVRRYGKDVLISDKKRKEIIAKYNEARRRKSAKKALDRKMNVLNKQNVKGNHRWAPKRAQSEAQSEAKAEGGEVDMELGDDTDRKPTAEELDIAAETVQIQVKRGRGRPRNKTTKKKPVKVGSRRSGRKRPWTEIQEVEVVVEEPRPKDDICGINAAPAWWKEAVLSAMLARSAMAEDGEDDPDTDIHGDPDFQDKGHYSDDEWLHDLDREWDRPKRSSIYRGKGLGCNSRKKALPPGRPKAKFVKGLSQNSLRE